MSEPEDRSSAGRQAGLDRAEGAARRAPCPVVGIGGSAGGIEAFRDLLAAVPPDCGMALVIIQHLSPHQESRLTEVLRRAARIEVVEIADDTPVEPNHAYVTPENAVITIRDGVLRVASPVGEEGRRAPIDLFLLSLAEDQGENAACIIVSGAGHDGTLGLRAIKEHGGLTMAQSAATAAHDSMLRSAVKTGLVDFQLAIKEMPHRSRPTSTMWPRSSANGAMATVRSRPTICGESARPCTRAPGTTSATTRRERWCGASSGACRCCRPMLSSTTSRN
ncbi:MAG: hypothetical protein K0S35_1385 [Geminicoccaceae bacterium]|nr:hypothetical protein [Geminicoccaceae bacterium]